MMLMGYSNGPFDVMTKGFSVLYLLEINYWNKVKIHSTTALSALLEIACSSFSS